MADDERKQERAEDAIDDLEAPEAAGVDVTGGKYIDATSPHLYEGKGQPPPPPGLKRI